MSAFEYKVIIAPKKPGRIPGVKGNDARFAHTLADLMNEMGSDGWEYQRCDTLPVEARSGLTGKTTTFQHMLVFRRDVDAAQDATPEVTPEAPDALFRHKLSVNPHEVQANTSHAPRLEPAAMAATVNGAADSSVNGTVNGAANGSEPATFVRSGQPAGKAADDAGPLILRFRQ